jgi:hypothetical protein
MGMSDEQYYAGPLALLTKQNVAPMQPVASHATEPEFQQWYADMAQRYQLSPNPEGQFYDYRAAMAAGAMPDETGHWPSEFKREGHPDLVKGGFDTRTGKRVPGTKQASERELIRLGWDANFARSVSRK